MTHTPYIIYTRVKLTAKHHLQTVPLHHLQLTILVVLLLMADGMQAQRRSRPQPVRKGQPINYVHKSLDRQTVANDTTGAHRTSSGIIVIGRGSDVRAMSAFGGSSWSLVEYANVANQYAKMFEGKAQVYVMPIPYSSEYYGTDVTRQWTHSQRDAIQNCFSRLNSGVHAVDIDAVLRHHTDEPIYSRTDHHWAPLGAYYAAQKFAEVAGVTFRDLRSYDSRTIHGFLGTMYKFSKDTLVKNAPEDFTYYMPRDVRYNTTFVDYTLDKARRRITSESAPHEAPFFREYQDGSPNAYLTFMAGDTHLVKVVTDTPTTRRLLVLKDSYGNAIPGYLFYGFGEIHVIDCRYFNQNIVRYIESNGITDILFANNIGHATSSKTTEMYKRYLTQ